MQFHSLVVRLELSQIERQPMFRAFVATLILLASPLVASGDIGVLFGPSPDLPASIVKTIDDTA